MNTKRRRIFFEGRGLVETHFSGIGQYILGILRGIDELLEQKLVKGEPVPDVRVIIPFDRVAKFNSYGFKHIRAKRFPLPFKIMSALWHRYKMLPLDLWCGRGYYVFTLYVTMPLLFSKSAVIIYDLSYELHKEYADEKNAAFLSRGVQKSLKQVDTVFTISRNSKKEIAEFYDFAPEKILIANPAANQRYFYRRSEEEIERVKTKYGIKNSYILALSNLEPRKNLDALVDAYCALPKKYRSNVSLLLVGVSGWKTDALFHKIIERVKEGYDIIRPSEYVSDKDKPAIISGARMLVYPSHYEGFGMPPLEAMACGVPVITANNSSLPEVVGARGVMLDCKNVVALTDTIKDTLDNLSMKTSESIIEGPAQANLFTWEKSAQVYWGKAIGRKR